MNEKNLKLVGYIGTPIVIITFLLFIFTVINGETFLILLTIYFVLVKFGLPKIKN